MCQTSLNTSFLHQYSGRYDNFVTVLSSHFSLLFATLDYLREVWESLLNSYLRHFIMICNMLNKNIGADERFMPAEMDFQGSD